MKKVLFDGISFQINEKERIGLVGVNGTGKSTLLRVMAGLETTERGKLTHANHFHVEYLPQQPEFDMESTVLEQVFHGDTPIMKALREYEWALAELQLAPEDEKRQAKLFAAQSRMDASGAWDAQTTAKTVLSKLGIRDFAQKVGTLSGGQRKRVAMARVLIQPADLLILDEPTNHIDHETVEWLEGFLAGWKGALLLVTHDRYFLDRVTNRMFELDRGKLYSYDGNYASFLEKKKRNASNGKPPWKTSGRTCCGASWPGCEEAQKRGRRSRRRAWTASSSCATARSTVRPGASICHWAQAV